MVEMALSITLHASCRSAVDPGVALFQPEIDYREHDSPPSRSLKALLPFWWSSGACVEKRTPGKRADAVRPDPPEFPLAIDTRRRPRERQTGGKAGGPGGLGTRPRRITEAGAPG